MHRTGKKNLWLGTLAILAVAVGNAAVPPSTETAIVGGILVDVSNGGRSSNDIVDSVVLIEGNKIVASGRASDIKVPSHFNRVDARGKFLIPGLIDGFGALRNQEFADAYLYEGVTTVYVGTILQGGGGDGEVKLFRNASPGPRLFLGAPMTGYSENGADPSDKPMTTHRLHDRRISNEQLVARLDGLGQRGYRGVTISYDVWPDQVDLIVAEAKRLGLATIGELGFTSYPYGIRAGINALLRNDQYQMELAPAAAKLAFADSQQAGAAYHFVCRLDPASSQVADYGDQIAKSNTALMPTLVLQATADSLDVPNPWSSPSSALIKAADLDMPVDKTTGVSGYLAKAPADRREAIRQCARHLEDLDARFYQSGAKFLAASISPSYGIMPGSGLHEELSLLHRIGLSPREAVAAATSNYADIYAWKDVGRIEPGRLADILILDDDPRVTTSALDRINTLIFDGGVVDRKRLLEGIKQN
jgi:hypothetical protein